MAFAKFGFNTGFVLGLIPWKQSLRNLDAYDLLREGSWGKPVKEGGKQDRTARRQWGQGNRILSFPWTLPHSGTARMTVCGKTQISSGEQLAKAWLGHTLEKHLFCGGVAVLRTEGLVLMWSIWTGYHWGGSLLQGCGRRSKSPTEPRECAVNCRQGTVGHPLSCPAHVLFHWSISHLLMPLLHGG